MALETSRDKFGENKITTTDTLTTDSVFFQLTLKTYFTAQNTGINLTPGCYATTKPQMGFKGLDIPLKSLTLISNNVFHDRSPGSDLGDLVKPADPYFDDQLYKLKELLNAKAAAYYPETDACYTVYLKERPQGNDALSHRFSFVLEYESGHKHFVNTNLVWK